MFSNPYYGDHVDFDFDVFGQHYVLNCDQGSFFLSSTQSKYYLVDGIIIAKVTAGSPQLIFVTTGDDVLFPAVVLFSNENAKLLLILACF